MFRNCLKSKTKLEAMPLLEEKRSKDTEAKENVKPFLALLDEIQKTANGMVRNAVDYGVSGPYELFFVPISRLVNQKIEKLSKLSGPLDKEILAIAGTKGTPSEELLTRLLDAITRLHDLQATLNKKTVVNKLRHKNIEAGMNNAIEDIKVKLQDLSMSKDPRFALAKKAQ